MTFTSSEAEVLKTDERGRVRVSRERREQILDEYERSGMSGVKFARMAGINYATFAGWSSRRRKARAATKSNEQGQKPGEGQIHLVEAMVSARTEPVEHGLAIELPGGACVQIGSPMQLRLAAELLALLGHSARRAC